MTPFKFEELLTLVAPKITRWHSRIEAIGPAERFCVTLRYLVTGDAFRTIAASYRLSDTVVGRIIRETCKALWNVMAENGFLSVPSSSKEWLDVSQDFERRWNFPNCVGAIDGKHIIIQCPSRAGSMFFNYKKFHSVVLMAVVNAKYQFTIVDVGDYGRLSDGSVFSSSQLGIAMEQNKLNLPPPRLLPGTNISVPYVFVGDDAFPLKNYLMKPYPRGEIQIPERIANYRFSRARRIVENAFGIATSRFRLFRRAITADVDVAVQATKAIVALHNYLMADRCIPSNPYCPSDFIDSDCNGSLRLGGWRRENVNNGGIQDVTHLGSNNYSIQSKNIRDCFRNYFNSTIGFVPWQDMIVTSRPCAFDRLVLDETVD